jgi:outer membrane PBP1 activator LpoA protein
VESAVDDMKRMGESAQETTEVMVEEAHAQVESWIAEVRVLIAEKKFPEAIERLEKLRKVELTTEQQQRVDELKAELENFSGKTIEAGRKALGGLLDGNR